ncbi:MAG: YicC family protein [Candidatus Marinimicrobia bacterium]|nr:YicC family protein [Candidatus Neomarinimicrobiota bacterium]MBV67981.1 YicC family protein [Candidatus Neomarinimicrobiota bacterium]|tara:strand:- start:2781 stop:3668 length:888 start_codon:yes stop_codon:yes gene_type:complete
MMMSMTGYGKRELENSDISISVELKSINSRYLEVNHKIPRLFSEEEDAMLALVRKKLLRGKIILNVNYTLLNDNLNQINLNENKVNEYISISRKLNSSKVIKDELTIDRLLTLPEVISTRTTSSNISYKRILSKSINDAISDLIIMRTKEGENLSKDILSRLKKIKKDLALIVKISERTQKEILRNYKKKIKLLFDDNDKIILDDSRLLQEIVIFMEKKDIHEEITRLQSHIDLFVDCIVKGKNEKGKRMTFLLQEFLREINTIGSKTDNIKTSHLVVSIKTEIEKIREQVQNIL